jgi:hypothetical protein
MLFTRKISRNVRGKCEKFFQYQNYEFVKFHFDETPQIINSSQSHFQRSQYQIIVESLCQLPIEEITHGDQNKFDIMNFERTGGRLTKNQLIEIVIFQLIESFNNEFIHI